MNTKLNNLLIFVTGAALGSLVTWKIAEKKYKQIIQEEVDSVDEYYRMAFGNKQNKPIDDSEEEEEYLDAESEKCEEIREGVLMGGNIDIPVPQEYTNLASRYVSKEVDEMADRPYVISPEEYGELDGYECISLQYYTDGVVADDFDNVIGDIDNTIGADALNHFGEYEDDCVFVRNDAKRCDYEILRDTRSFSKDILGED